MIRRAASILSLLLLGAATLTGCRLVDEDMTDCGTEYTLDYELRLVTNMRTELKTVLNLEADLTVSTALESYLDGVFSDFAHDVDLSFYDTAGEMSRLEHIFDIMNANQSSYTLYIPVRDYMHACVANLAGEEQVSLEGVDSYRSLRLVQHADAKGTVGVHTTGIFAARLPMHVLEGVNQNFEVSLYMVNAASTLVLDTSSAPGIEDISVVATGFADGFNVSDSTYTFDTAQIVQTKEIPLNVSALRCFTSVHFPSRSPQQATKSIIEVDDDSPSGQEALWEWRVYTRLKDGTTTESIVYVYSQLLPGHFKVVKGRVLEDGSVSSSDKTVGVNVTLDWSEGGQHNISL